MGNILFLNLFKQNTDEFETFSWERQLKELLLAKPNDKYIYWLVDNKGTAKLCNFMYYMAKNHNAIIAPGCGSTMKLIVSEFIFSNGYEPKIILIDAVTKMDFKKNKLFWN